MTFIKIKYSKEAAADFVIMFTAAVIGASTVVIKVALKNISPFAFLTARFLLALIILLGLFHKILPRSRKKDWVIGVITGLFFFSSLTSQLLALQYTTVANVNFLAALAVIILPIIETIRYRRPPSTIIICCIILCTLGLYMLTGSQASGFNLGDALSISCAVFYSFMVIIIARYANEVDNIIMSIGQLATATILSALGLFIWEPLNTTQIMDNWFPILFVGIFATALIIPLQISAQKYTSPTKVGIFVLLEPVVGTILAVIFINEILTKNSQIGCVLILLGLLMIKYEEYIKEKKSTNKTQLHC